MTTEEVKSKVEKERYKNRVGKEKTQILEKHLNF
jgi:hypothetical protein